MELIKYENNEIILAQEMVAKIVELEKAAKEIQEKEEEIRSQLLEAMEQHAIKKLDTPEITITYVAGGDREQFDKKKFQKDHPKMYDSYITMKTTNPYITIKTK